MSSDLTASLRLLMTAAQISSWRQLSQLSGVPRSQLTKIRQGQLERIPWGSLQSLSQTLNLAEIELLQTLGALSETPALSKTDCPTDDRASDPIYYQWQREVLAQLESLILQLPTASHAAQKNPTAPAVRLLPLFQPLFRLLNHWQVQTIGRVGDTVAFDPHQHQWIDATPPPVTGTTVLVRYVGYRHGDRLLHRAKVSQPSA